MNGVVLVVVALAVVTSANEVQRENKAKTRCAVPQKAPKNIEKVIGTCQDEIKYVLLTEAIQSLAASTTETPITKPEDVPEVGAVKNRRRRSFFNEDEKRIAGCLLHCVFRKKNALNDVGFPTLEGMVTLYAEGVTDKAYVLATIQAVHICLNKAQLKHLLTPQSLQEKGKTCDIAYDVFDCVSDKIAEVCGQTP